MSKSNFTKAAIGIFLSATVLGIQGCKQDSKATAAGQLISAFQSGCVTAGRWTDIALSHNAAITQVLQSLKDQDPCKAHVGTIAQIQSASTQIQRLLSDTSYSSYRLAEERLQELTLALSAAPAGSDLASLLGDLLVTAQVNLAEQRASRNVSDRPADRDRFAQATLDFSNYMQGLIQSTDGIRECLKTSPSAAFGLASNLMALGGSFISPTYGAGASVVAQLISLGVEAARSSKTSDALWALYSAQMPTALSCGLEAMTELYCDANDAYDLVALQASSYSGAIPSAGSIWEGIDLLSRRMPVITNWLSSVKNGSAPRDAYDSERQNQVWRKLNTVDEYYRNINADLSKAQELFNGAQGKPTLQQDILVKTILGIAGQLSGSGGNGGVISGGMPTVNPFRDKSGDINTYARWIVLGVNVADPQPDTQNGEYGETYIRKKLISLATMNKLIENWLAIYDEVKVMVEIEFAQTITADPAGLLATAREPSADNISPRNALSMLKGFLERMRDTSDGSNPELPYLLGDTITLLSDALKLIDNQTTDEQGKPLKPLDRVQKLFNTFNLSKGLQYFQERINNFVLWDMQAKIRKGDLPTDAAEILRAAGGDIRSRLTASGIRDLTPVVQDLNRARQITQANIQAFREFFLASLGKSVEQLDNAAKAAGEPSRGANRPNGQVLGELCALILATGSEWPKAPTQEICSRAVLDSIYPDPDGKLSLEIPRLTTDLEGKPFQKRVCAFHRYLRAGRLAEAVQTPSRDVFVMDFDLSLLLETIGKY